MLSKLDKEMAGGEYSRKQQTRAYVIRYRGGAGRRAHKRAERDRRIAHARLHQPHRGNGARRAAQIPPRIEVHRRGCLNALAVEQTADPRRGDSSYTDSIIALIAEQASGATLAQASRDGCFGGQRQVYHCSRCFAVAFRERGRTNLSRSPWVHPRLSDDRSQSLIRQGEIRLSPSRCAGGRLVLLPRLQSWDVTGDVRPRVVELSLDDAWRT